MPPTDDVRDHATGDVFHVSASARLMGRSDYKNHVYEENTLPLLLDLLTQEGFSRGSPGVVGTGSEQRPAKVFHFDIDRWLRLHSTRL